MQQSNHAYEKDVFGKIMEGVSRKALVPQLFKPTVMVGKNFKWAVDTENPGGFTIVSSPAINTLNAPITGAAIEPSVRPYTLYSQEDIDADFIRSTRGAGVDGGNARAYASAKLRAAKKVKDALMHHNDYLQVYGQDDVGAYSTSNATANGSPTVTSVDVVINEGDWLPALKSSIGHEFDAYNASGDVLLNTNAALVLADFTQNTRTLNFTGNATDLAAISSTSPSAINVYLVPREAGSKASPAWTAGLKKILSASSGDTLYGVSAGPNFRATQQSVGGALTQSTIYGGLVEVTNARGLGSTDFVLLTSTASHGDLLASFDDEVRWTGNQPGSKTAGTNAMSITFDGHKVKLVASSKVKQGDAFLFPERYVKRVRTHNNECFYEFAEKDGEGTVPYTTLENKAGIRIRAGVQEALCVGMPSACHYFSGITPTYGN